MKALRLVLVIVVICLLVRAEAKAKSRSGRRRNRRRITTTTTTARPTTSAAAAATQPPPAAAEREHKPQFNMNGPVPQAPPVTRRGRGPEPGRRRTVPGAPVGPQSVGLNRLSNEEKLILLEAHNDFRGQVQPTAANMVALQWDEHLADMAQAWTDQCTFNHGGTEGGGRYTWVGQNLWAGSGTGWELYGMVESWYNEEEYYNYAYGNCNSVCGHYTQVVWAQSQFVGCALKTCQSIAGLSGWSPASILVCNYGEGGNYIGMKPYISGVPCSQCPGEYTACIDGELCALPSQAAEAGEGDEMDSDPSPELAPNPPLQGGNGAPGPMNPEPPAGSSPTDDAQCGGVLEEASGEITSPNWPAPYGTNQDCQWIIRGKSDQTVTLEVEYMDIEPEKQCSWDYLQVKPHGVSGTSTTKYCGNVSPQAVTSVGSELAVAFRSDSSVNRGGFMASYQLNGGKQGMGPAPSCGGTLSGNKGTITSPNYPREYGEDLDCLWVIKVASNNRVRLAFKALDVEENAMCGYDRLTVRLGNERLPMTFCGNEKPNGNIISLSNRMEVRLQTDQVGNRRGFSAIWKAI